MLYQLIYYSYYLNYIYYFLGTYYICGSLNMVHDIYTKIRKKHNEINILFMMEQLNDNNEWVVVD